MRHQATPGLRRDESTHTAEQFVELWRASRCVVSDAGDLSFFPPLLSLLFFSCLPCARARLFQAILTSTVVCMSAHMQCTCARAHTRNARARGPSILFHPMFEKVEIDLGAGPFCRKPGLTDARAPEIGSAQESKLDEKNKGIRRGGQEAYRYRCIDDGGKACPVQSSPPVRSRYVKR